MTPEQSKALRGKMPENLVSKFPSNAGANANKEYVGHAAVTDRLLEVDPEWTWKFLGDGTPVFDDVGGIWIELTVCGVTRIGYGFPERLKGGNAVKEAIGDAIRNAAMRFGVGLEFWFKGDLFAEPDKGGLLLNEEQLKELSIAISATYSKDAAFKYLRARIGVDDISKLTASQFGQAMELIGSVPKPDDVMMPAQKDKFYRELIAKNHIPVELLKALGYEDSKLTFKQRNEIEDYIKTDAYKASKEQAA